MAEVKQAIGAWSETEHGAAHIIALAGNWPKRQTGVVKRLQNKQDLKDAVAWLVQTEPRFGPVVLRHGLPSLRHSEPGLKSLLRIVTDQLISLKAGEAIWNRLSLRLGSLTPDEVLACPESELRSLGLSGVKALSFHAAARAFQAGIFRQDGVSGLSEQELFRRLTDIPGVGPWTANLYLMMVHRAADVWPAGDIALQHAARQLFDLAQRPTARELTWLAEPWRPCRSTAALLLWSHYRDLKQLPQG
jgi:DNA-3-methyladenine glycosylase II